MMRRAALAALVVAGTLARARPVSAQIAASEEATFSQRIDGTDISMRFARPSRRGRAVLFGGQMPWGERWTPGANQATTFRTSKDIRLGDKAVPTGAYSVWLDLVEGGPWRLVLDPDTTLFHTQHPPDKDTQIVIPVEPQAAPERETLLWYVDSIRATGGQLRMHWGTTEISLPLKVPPSQRLAATPEEARSVVGAWEGSEAALDSAKPGPGFTLTIRYDDATGLLVGTMRFTTGMDEVPSEVMLLPAAQGIFAMGWGENGELWEVMPILVEFSGGGDGAYGGFEARDTESDAVVFSGHRVGAGTQGGPPR